MGGGVCHVPWLDADHLVVLVVSKVAHLCRLCVPRIPDNAISVDTMISEEDVHTRVCMYQHRIALIESNDRYT